FRKHGISLLGPHGPWRQRATSDDAAVGSCRLQALDGRATAAEAGGPGPHYRTPITERIDLLTFLWVGFWVCPARFPGTVDFVSFYTASCEFRYSVRTSVWCPA